MPAPVIKTVFISTAGTGTYTMPSDFDGFISVEAIGGGGGSLRSDASGGAGGSGGGAYSKSTTMTGLSAGITAYYQVGAGGTAGTTAGNGGDSWFSLTNAAPSASSSGADGVLAKGGTAATGTAGGAGGVSTSGTGDVRNSGGNGGAIGTGSPPGRGGGGGAAGPGGNGGNGSNTAVAEAGGGGGGGASLINPGNNASAGTGGNGGGGTGGGAPGATGVAGTAGTGGGGGGATSTNGGAGGTGSYWTQSSNLATAGSGGGGGGSAAGVGDSGGAGALYGGGSGGSVFNGSIGGAGARGIIVFTYYARVGSGFKKPDDVFGTIDLDDQYITDSWLVDQFVGGTLFAWGSNTIGKLGTAGVNNYYSSPIQVGSLNNWKYVATGLNSSFAIKTDGTLWSWGSNSGGVLGDGTTTNRSSPVQVGAFTDWKQVSGWDATLAVRSNGQLYAWGPGAGGILGGGPTGTIASTANYSAPIQVGTMTNWKSITVAGFTSAFAIKQDGTLWVWGANQFGKLGTGNLTSFSSPVQIGSMNNWKQVSSGDEHTLAVKTDGTLWAWGANFRGALGTGFAGATAAAGGYYSSPIQIGSMTNWKQVVVSGAGLGAGGSSFAIKTDGTLWAWGSNVWGVLGTAGVNNYYSSPIQVGSLNNWKQVNGTVTSHSIYATKTDGTLWAWGANFNGQLGIGFSGGYYSSPIQVGSLTNWKYVAGIARGSGGASGRSAAALGVTFTDLN